MNESLNTTAMRMLLQLREDELPANSVGSGNIDESSGILHLWHNGRKACGGRSHVGGVISLDSHKFSASEPEHRCKRCDARFKTLRTKFPHFGKPKTDEDAGTSQDSVPANNVGGAQIDGIGVGAKGEPGAHRRRKRLARAQDPKFFKALAAEGHVEFDLSDAGRRRFNEGLGSNDGRLGHINRPHPKGPIDARPEIPLSAKEIDPNPRKKKLKTPSKLSLKRGPDACIALNPVIPTRFEDVNEGLPGGISRIDYLIRIGLPRQDAVKKINYYRVAIKDPEVAMRNSTYRQYVVEVLEKLLLLIFNDAQLYNRVRALLQKDDHPRGENELPEDADDIFERKRFARWKAARASD